MQIKTTTPDPRPGILTNHTGLSPMMKAMGSTRPLHLPEFNLDSCAAQLHLHSSGSSSPGTLTPSPAVSPRDSITSHGSSGRDSNPSSRGSSPSSSPSASPGLGPKSSGRRKRSSPSASLNRDRPPQLITHWDQGQQLNPSAGIFNFSGEVFFTPSIKGSSPIQSRKKSDEDGATSGTGDTEGKVSDAKAVGKKSDGPGGAPNKLLQTSHLPAYKVITCSSPGSTRTLKRAKGRGQEELLMQPHSFAPTSAASPVRHPSRMQNSSRSGSSSGMGTNSSKVAEQQNYERLIKRALSFCKASGFLAEAQLTSVARGIGQEVAKASPRAGTEEGMAAARRLVAELCAALRQEQNEGLLEELVRGEVHPSMALLALPMPSAVSPITGSMNVPAPVPLERASSDISGRNSSKDNGDSSTDCTTRDSTSSIAPPELRRSRSAPTTSRETTSSSPIDDSSSITSSPAGYVLTPENHAGVTPGRLTPGRIRKNSFDELAGGYEPDDMEQEWLDSQLEKPDEREQQWLDSQLEEVETVRQAEFEDFWQQQIQQSEIEEIEMEMEMEHQQRVSPRQLR